MAAPATAERRRPAAGTIPGILNAAAPFELKLEGVEDAAEVVDEEIVGITADTDDDETGLVDVGEAVEAVAVPDEVEEALEVVDDALLEETVAVPMENVLLVERTSFTLLVAMATRL